MFENTFNRKPIPPPRRNTEECKIKIKNTSSGKQISFSGNCSKEQLEMAKMGFLDNDTSEED